MVYSNGFEEGVRREKKRSTFAAFSRGVVAGFVLGLVFVGVAVAQTIPPQANEYRRDLIRLSRSVWGMDAPVSTLAAQIHQESSWRPAAVSSAGAKGLAQFMPATAAGLARDYADFAQPFDPRWSMLYQSRYMRRLYEQVAYARDDCERYAFALSSYNGGMKWVQRRQQMSVNPAYCLYQTCEINPGILASNQRENSEYSKNILLRLTPVYYQAQWGAAKCYP